MKNIMLDPKGNDLAFLTERALLPHTVAERRRVPVCQT
jgi:hypothetical protein